MFYSHEILTSRQFGVATIWLVATSGTGKSTTTRKVTRKAIQEVNVEKACGKILEPGAPIALRLQGNLLYGVSRVYHQQCSYMLNDAKKTQMDMEFFITNFGNNQLDPEAGQARPENLLVEDDPAFIPEMQLPVFDLDALIVNPGSTQKTSSQMSPFQDSLLSRSQSSGRGFPVNIDLAQSESSGPRGATPLGLQGISPAQKLDEEPLIFPQEHNEDIFGGAGDWGLEVDEHGNVVERMDVDGGQGPEPELPPLPIMDDSNTAQAHPPEHQQGQRRADGEGDVDMVNIMEEEPLPEAEPFPERQAPDEPVQDGGQPARQAAARRKRKGRRLQRDEELVVGRNVVRMWQDNYLEECCTKPVRPVSQAQARRNAMLYTFGLGISNIGQDLGVPGLMHPLALDFSGDRLFTAITGLDVLAAEQSRGQRRSASAATEADREQEQRRVRPRLEGEGGEVSPDQQARGLAGDGSYDLNLDDPFAADQSLVEVGREAEHLLSDQHSSAMPLPWNRGSSAIPSSVRAAGSAQKPGRDLSSPLRGRGDVADIVRYSDDAHGGGGGGGGSEGFGPAVPGGLGSADSSFGGMGLDPAAGGAGEEGKEGEEGGNNDNAGPLGRESQNFLGFVADAVREDGVVRDDADYARGRRWVALDDLLPPARTPRATAAQAFLHALGLATASRLAVKQENENDREAQARGEAFGPVYLSTDVGEKKNAGASAVAV
ncbi:Rec8 like protein-domain-containing protein [Xylariaceae sp. FL0804]|nr:Rec8 like protein-domain-containing protein [Xylariaceae sp. FL0804]